MVDHRDFFNELNEKLNGKCEFAVAGKIKPTYIHYTSKNGNEIQVNITTRFNPKNTVRIQMFSENCTKVPQVRITTENEINAIEKNIGQTFSKPAPSEVSHNPEAYQYYQLPMQFTLGPNDIINEVASNLITIFNTLSKF